MPHPIVDRRTEFGIFRAMLQSSEDRGESILLLKNESGQGKSRLLHLYETHCRDHNIPVARVDFKGGSLTPIDVIRTVQTDFRPLSLQRCIEVLHQMFQTPTVQIKDNTGLGQTHYSVQTNVHMTGLTIEEQRIRWESGAQAFVDDIFELTNNKVNRFVLLFDTYEQASDETRKWLSNHILRMATPQRINSLLIVIAGKEIPAPTGEWDHYHKAINLEPLQLEDWMEYARLVIGEFHPEYIERIYARYKHSPLEMANVINALAPVGDVPHAG